MRVKGTSEIGAFVDTGTGTGLRGDTEVGVFVDTGTGTGLRGATEIGAFVDAGTGTGLRGATEVGVVGGPVPNELRVRVKLAVRIDREVDEPRAGPIPDERVETTVEVEVAGGPVPNEPRVRVKLAVRIDREVDEPRAAEPIPDGGVETTVKVDVWTICGLYPDVMVVVSVYVAASGATVGAPIGWVRVMVPV